MWTWAIDAAAVGSPSKWAKTSPKRPSEGLVDRRPHDFEGLGHHPVPKAAELGHELVGEDPLGRGDDLSELDVRGAEMLERPAEPPSDVLPRGGATPPAPRIAHPATAVRRWPLVLSSRPSGGSRRRRTRSGTWARVSGPDGVETCRHGRSSNVTSHGPVR